MRPLLFLILALVCMAGCASSSPRLPSARRLLGTISANVVYVSLESASPLSGMRVYKLIQRGWTVDGVCVNPIVRVLDLGDNSGYRLFGVAREITLMEPSDTENDCREWDGLDGSGFELREDSAVEAEDGVKLIRLVEQAVQQARTSPPLAFALSCEGCSDARRSLAEVVLGSPELSGGEDGPVFDLSFGLGYGMTVETDSDLTRIVRIEIGITEIEE